MPLYSAYGLTIKSDFLLPELLPGEGKIDLHIHQGKIQAPKLEPTNIKRQGVSSYFGGNDRAAYLHWPDVATFCAQDGRYLTVQPERDELESRYLNLYILSEALGMILYQRGYLLLHGSAVKVKGKAVIFAGAPGAGKSTMAAAFSRLGYPLLGDDMVAVKFTTEGQVMVYPGFPQIKIWSPTVQGLKLKSEALSPLFSGSHKKLLRPRRFLPEPLPLARCFILSRGEKLQLSSLEGHKALMSLFRFFSCPGQMLVGESLDTYRQLCLELTKIVPIYALKRPDNFRVLNKFVNWLIEEMKKKQLVIN
ncbi:MAG: hypothetical protein AAGA80_19560 [Cyanobacteria bacterium P01_F01_bin.143]